MRRVSAVVAAAMVLANCDSAATQPTFAIDTIPTVNAAADQGCVDEAGTLHAHAADWYPGPTGGLLFPSGELSNSAELDAFVSEATDAVAVVAPGFTLSEKVEYRRAAGACATHRHAFYSSGDEEIIVSIWRVESAADPWEVPNESTFEAIDDSTLVSRGRRIAVVLAVAPDGTTSRVSAYGARARELVAGWPSTAAPNPSADPAGETPVTADELIPVAQEILAYALSQRGKK